MSPIKYLRLLLISVTAIAANAQTSSPASSSTSAPAAGAPKLVAGYGKLPLAFEPNLGQTDPQVQWLARGPEYTLFLAGHDAVLRLNAITPARKAGEQPKISGSAVRMSLVGAKTADRGSGEEPLPGKANYFTGKDPAKWQRNVPMYGKVRLQGVYPGVDLVYYGSQGQLEYDFLVAPGADASAIQLRFNGTKPDLAANGDLTLPVDGGPEVRFNKPVVYQMVDGVRHPVDGSFTIAGANNQQQVSFHLEPTTITASWLSTPRCSSSAHSAPATMRLRLTAWR